MIRTTPAAVAAAALVAALGCGGPLLEAEVKSIRVTVHEVELTGVPGVSTIGDIEADLGVELPDEEDGVVSDLELKAVRVAWADPANHPDFSGFTSATLTVVPDPASGLPSAVVATYVQDPANPDPDELTIRGDPAVNLRSYLTGETLTFRIDGQGSTPPYVWTSFAHVSMELGLRVEYTP